MIERKVMLEDILAAKEARRQRQQAMLANSGLTLVSITVNMPGPIKDGMLLRKLCNYAAEKIKSRANVREEQIHYMWTGPEALLSVDSNNAQAIKSVAISIEEANSFGRLLDIDVFTPAGDLVSRQQQGKGRNCLVCGQPALVCMREQNHTADELNEAVEALLADFSAYLARRISLTAEKIGALALQAMLYEASCTPAPGLVDRVNSGAHTDMDFYTFMASSSALSMAMARTAQAGINHNDTLPKLLPVLRSIGKQAEREMLCATNGINTQKGLLFSLGIVTAAAGWLWREKRQLKTTEVLNTAARIVAGIVERELGVLAGKGEKVLTAGERLYRDHGITGIRGELEQGLPAISDCALPMLKKSLEEGLSINDALLNTLLTLMTCVDDTTVMNRHNPEKMRSWVRDKAQSVLAEGGAATSKGRLKAEALDEEFTANNISPGGAADLLAVTWFLYQLENGLTL